MALSKTIEAIDAGLEQSLKRLKELLAIPSIGTDPAYHADTRNAAIWLKEQLIGLGFEADLKETPGMPVVLGHYRHPDPKKPHLLYYGHYDVQPADPLDLWDSPPFDAQIVNGPHGRRIVARGAVDDKGQLMTWVEAFRYLIEAEGELPCSVTAVIEGEEESGSVNLEQFLLDHQEELKADYCIVSDTGMLGPDMPAITTQLRGIAYCEVTLYGPGHDLHSGMYGGAVINPINELCRLLAGLHDAQGRVTLSGFYDGVRPLPVEQKKAWDNINFDEKAFLASAGLIEGKGEKGYSLLERIWARPCLDINGIGGGYQDPGSKTVIASKAFAKLSCRLVLGQDALAVMESLEDYFQSQLDPQFKLEFRKFSQGDAVAVPLDLPIVEASRAALDQVFPNPSLAIGCGGSIPVAAKMKGLLGMDTLLLGFGLEDDRMHSPNEKFEVVCFERGIKTHAALLKEISS